MPLPASTDRSSSIFRSRIRSQATLPRLVADFAAGFLYVNIHSANYENGEIRGQLLGPAPAASLGDVPTLGGWMAMVMAAALLAFAFWRMK
jgi:hypothetical protein